MSHGENMQDPTRSPVGRLIGLCLEYKLLVAIGVLLLIFGGIMMAPRCRPARAGRCDPESR